MGLYNIYISRENIDFLVFVLTGMRGIDFSRAFQVKMADELLRYTDLGMADVSKRAGFGSAKNLYLTHNREFGIAPSEQSQMIRMEEGMWISILGDE